MDFSDYQVVQKYCRMIEHPSKNIFDLFIFSSITFAFSSKKMLHLHLSKGNLKALVYEITVLVTRYYPRASLAQHGAGSQERWN